MHRTNTVCACGRPQAFSHVLSEISPAEISVFCSTATASVTSVTTDDTGIESSSLGASPTLPCCPKSLQHAEIKATPWGKEQPPPIPPKAGRQCPPIPPKPFMETFEVVKSNLHKSSGSTCLPSTGCFSTSSLPPENVTVKVPKGREPEVTHNVHSSSALNRLHSGDHLSPFKHEVNKTGRLIPLPSTSPNRNRVLIPQSECSNCGLLRKTSCSKRTSYSSLGPSFLSRKNCPTSCSYSPDRNSRPSVCSIEASQPCLCQVNRHWNVKSLPPTPNQVQPTFRKMPPSDLNCDIWSTPRLFNLAVRPNYTGKSASKPGCGSLQWISHTLTRVFCTGLGRGRSTETKNGIVSGINNDDSTVCVNNLSEPSKVPIVSASASTTNSIISPRGHSKSSVACGVSLWHNRSRSCYCSHNTVPSGTLPSGLSSASYHSSPARRTNRMNSPTKSHVIPPPTPASLDPELFSGISHSVLVDSKDKRKLCGMNLSGRSHPVPPSRTADVLQKHNLSRWALHAPSLSMEVPKSDCSCICPVQPTSTVPTSSQAMVDLPDLVNSPDRKPSRHLYAQTKHRYWKPRKKLSIRPRCSSSVAADKLPDGPAPSNLTNELLSGVRGEALPPLTCGQPNVQCSRICSRQHSPCELPSRTLVDNSNPHRETTCMVLDRDDQVHHVHHIHHVHHVYHYHHHLPDLGILTQSDSTIPGFLSSTTSLKGQLCCSKDSGRPHNLPATTPVSCGCPLEFVGMRAQSLSREMLGIQQSVVTNLCPAHLDSGVSRTQTPNPPSQPRSSATPVSPVPITSCHSSSNLCCPLYCLQQQQQQQQQSHFGPGCTLHPILETFATRDVISVTGDGAVSPIQPSGSSDNSPPNPLTAHSQDPCALISSTPGRLTVANCVQPVASKSVLPVSEPISPRSQQRADDLTTSAVPSASPTSVERTLAPLPVRTSAIVTPMQSTRVSRTGRTLTSSIPFSATDLQQSRLSFQRSMLELRKMGWYWGPLTFQEAQVLLAKRPDGTFLVRDSGHDTYILSLSFRVRGETYHTRIEHSLGRFSFWSQPQSHSANTMVEFIEKAVAHSISGQFHYFLQSSAQGQPPVEVPLLYPLSRFQVVPSLRHLARFTILSCIRRDHINQLPLPHSLLNYLMEKQCYAESLEAFEEAIRDRGPLEFRPRQVVSSEPTPDSPAIEQSLASTDETLPEVQRTTVSRRSTASNDSVASVDSQVTVRPTAVPTTPSPSC